MGEMRLWILSTLCAALLLFGSLPGLATSASQDGDEAECEDDWASLESEAFPGQFKVWATCTGEYEDDLKEARVLIESFWGPMTEFMRVEPVPDEGTELAGGDTAIDFYLLASDEDVPSRGLSAPGAIGAAAYVRSVPPEVGVASSSVAVMSREDMGDPFFTFVLIHEFFHVLQNARNTGLGFNWDIRPDDDPEWDTLVFAEHWWTEAMANWAGFYFTRENPEIDGVQCQECRVAGRQALSSYALSAPS
jgi:hypothetical protein